MVWPTALIFSLLLGQGLAGYDSGYYTPSPTVYWTPTTTSYWSTWTPTSAYVTQYTQQNVVVTVTSYYPCPITSTVVYWECCDQCQNNCYNPPTLTDYPEPTSYYPGGGTTTLTLYTTTTPGAITLQTITSNGLVIVMVSSGIVQQSATPSVVYQFSSQAAVPLSEGAWSSIWSMGIVLAGIATLMILL